VNKKSIKLFARVKMFDSNRLSLRPNLYFLVLSLFYHCHLVMNDELVIHTGSIDSIHRDPVHQD